MRRRLASLTSGRTVARWAAAAVVAGGTLLLLASLGTRIWVDADAAERRLSKLLSGPGREATASVGRAEASLHRRRIRLESVSAVLTAAGGRPPGRSVRIEAEEIELEGVSLLSLLFGGGLEARTLRLRRPSVVDSGGGRMDGAGGESGGEETATGADGPLAGLAQASPPVSLDRLEVEQARVTVVRARTEEPAAPAGWEKHLLEGLTLRLQDVSLGGGAERNAAGSDVSVRGGEMALDRYRSLLPGGMHGLEVRGVEVGALNIAVYSDKRLPPPPGAPPPEMPTELVRDAGRPIRVDTLRVESGRVEYSERTAAASRPGRVSFEEIDATFYNLTNDSSRMTPGTPAVVRVTARLFGAGRLRAVFRSPLLAPGLDLSFAGELEEMDLRSFNDMLVPVEGIRLESGHLEGLDFDARVRDGVAAGSLRARYRDLDLAKVDPGTGGQSLTDLVRSLLMGARIEDSNPPSDGEEPRTGIIEHRREPGDPFFKFLWESVRSGLLSVVGA